MRDLLKEAKEVCKAIEYGHEWEIEDWGDGHYIKVENPEFQPDNGEDPYLAIRVSNT